MQKFETAIFEGCAVSIREKNRSELYAEGHLFKQLYLQLAHWR